MMIDLNLLVSSKYHVIMINKIINLWKNQKSKNHMNKTYETMYLHKIYKLYGTG